MAALDEVALAKANLAKFSDGLRKASDKMEKVYKIIVADQIGAAPTTS